MMRLTLAAAALAASIALPQAAAAAPTACPDHFLAGSAPDLRREPLARKARALCFSGYSVLHSGLTRTPLWAAERLTADRVADAREQERVNRFHADPRLPADERAELEDYERGGFDRGHMAPSGDFADPRSQAESFTLANMVPQDADLNRGLWAGIEAAVRGLATRHGEAYVVTGPVFEGDRLRSLKGRVAIPTSVYKAVYVPATRSAGAYVAENAPGRGYRVIPVAELTALIGMDVFPSLPADVKARAAQLPEPTRTRSIGPAKGGSGGSGSWADWLPDAAELARGVSRMLR